MLTITIIGWCKLLKPQVARIRIKISASAFLNFLHANKCALSHLILHPISSSPSEQSFFPSQRSAIGMHRSSRLQKNWGSGPMQCRLEFEWPTENAEVEWLENRSATISEGMRAWTAVADAAASQSGSRSRMMVTARPTLIDLARPPASCPRISPPPARRIFTTLRRSKSRRSWKKNAEFSTTLSRFCLQLN